MTQSRTHLMTQSCTHSETQSLTYLRTQSRTCLKTIKPAPMATPTSTSLKTCLLTRVKVGPTFTRKPDHHPSGRVDFRVNVDCRIPGWWPG